MRRNRRPYCTPEALKRAQDLVDARRQREACDHQYIDDHTATGRTKVICRICGRFAGFKPPGSQVAVWGGHRQNGSESPVGYLF